MSLWIRISSHVKSLFGCWNAFCSPLFKQVSRFGLFPRMRLSLIPVSKTKAPCHLCCGRSIARYRIKTQNKKIKGCNLPKRLWWTVSLSQALKPTVTSMGFLTEDSVHSLNPIILLEISSFEISPLSLFLRGERKEEEGCFHPRMLVCPSVWSSVEVKWTLGNTKTVTLLCC